jgi:hypothetical protein
VFGEHSRCETPCWPGARVNARSSSCGSVNAALADARFGQSPALLPPVHGYRWLPGPQLIMLAPSPTGEPRFAMGPSRRGPCQDRYGRL